MPATRWGHSSKVLTDNSSGKSLKESMANTSASAVHRRDSRRPEPRLSASGCFPQTSLLSCRICRFHFTITLLGERPVVPVGIEKHCRPTTAVSCDLLGANSLKMAAPSFSFRSICQRVTTLDCQQSKSSCQVGGVSLTCIACLEPFSFSIGGQPNWLSCKLDHPW